MSSPVISMQHITKRFGDVVAVNNVSLRINSGSTFAFLGTSGSGKTTTLKMINRLVEPTTGDIRVLGKRITDFDPIDLRRKLGYVIQRGGLFPHWSVRGNVGLVPRMLKWPKARIDGRCDELLNLVGMPAADYRNRFPSELSGGQQQRVGIARALAADPGVLLLDEPFSALDPITRTDLQKEFIALKKKLDKTVVLVTHDVREAMHMADQILILDQGRPIQLGTPEELRDNPQNEFVKSFMKSQLQ